MTLDTEYHIIEVIKTSSGLFGIIQDFALIDIVRCQTIRKKF